MQKVNLSEKFSLFHDHWNPRIVGELNNQHVKLVRFKGEFVWHKHDLEDEMFFVISESSEWNCGIKTLNCMKGNF